MIHVNSWSPDTCGCVVLFSWDDSVPVEERIHTPVHTHKNDVIGDEVSTKRCPPHDTPDIPNIEELHECIKDENKTKNEIYKHLLDDHPKLVRIRTENGQEVKELDPAVGFAFSFSGEGKNRSLEIDVKSENLTPADKEKIRDFVLTSKRRVNVK